MQPEFTTEEVLSSLTDLPLQDQVAVLEGLVGDAPMAEVADTVALCLMSVGLDLDASCSDELRARVEALSAKVRAFNEHRFGSAPPVE